MGYLHSGELNTFWVNVTLLALTYLLIGFYVGLKQTMDRTYWSLPKVISFWMFCLSAGPLGLIFVPYAYQADGEDLKEPQTVHVTYLFLQRKKELDNIALRMEKHASRPLGDRPLKKVTKKKKARKKKSTTNKK